MKSDDERALIVFRRIDQASATDLVIRGRQDLHSLQGESDENDAEHAYAEGMRFHGKHFDGERLKDDLFASVRWLRIAAEKGHAEAQYMLGHLFTLGSEWGGRYIGSDDGAVSDCGDEYVYHEYVDSLAWLLAATEHGHALDMARKQLL